METRIIHNKVIFDIDGKVPFNKVFNIWWNVMEGTKSGKYQ